MKKNGFTFAELIAVIVIISILSLISIPTIEKIIKENEKSIYQTQLNNIVLGLKNWASDNKEFLPEEDGDILTLTLGQLKFKGYMEYETKNPNTNKCFSNDMLLEIKKNKKNYKYSIIKSTIKEIDDCSFDTNKPSILLNGDIVELVEANSVFVDKGVTALDKDGEDITSNISKTITGSGNVVDTSIIGNEYRITYTITDNGKTTSLIRTVRIVDRESPELIIPGSIVINDKITSFDVMNGVSVTDNSKEVITPFVKTNISFGIPGKYKITYTATDSSGNKAVKTRMITIKESYRDVVLNGADPEFGLGMIPIVINSTTGVATVADIYNETTPWYDYEQKKWANVVTLTEASRSKYIENGTYKSGTEVSEADILTYLTWIPRYKYKLWNVDNFATTGVDTSKVHSIEIVFESKNTDKSNGSTNGSYLTHPAFTFGSEELNGMWVGKFETGYSGTEPGNVTASDKVVIKPNMTNSDIRSWRNIQVANAFYAVLGMNAVNNVFGFNSNQNDTHMMKNTEWGAVAYLSHSKYGINYEVRLNNNNGYKTGCGALEGKKAATEICDNQYGTVTSYPQSTTGNITGVFDMAGGAWEYVMGVVSDSSGKMYSGRNDNYNSKFIGKLGYPNDGTDTTKNEIVAATEGLAENQLGGGKAVPDSKYYDLYPYIYASAREWSKRILGDATGELGPFNVSGSYTNSWYNDYSLFVYSVSPWFIRGGYNGYASAAGIFASDNEGGRMNGANSFRVVVTNK